MNIKLTDYQAQLLKFIEKEKKWKKDMTLIVESENFLKAKVDSLEKRLQEKEKELEKVVIPPITKPGELSIIQALVQVSMKELELRGLKHQNKNLEGLAVERECERKNCEAKCAKLYGKNDKLIKQVTRQLPMKGAKHIIWDALISKATKLRRYLDYILDK